jgi:hypothetical protein
MIAKLPITTKLSAETLAQLEAQAQAQGLTRSGAITLAIEAWLGIEHPATPASPTGTLARLDSLSGQLEALSGRVSAIEARLAPGAPTAPHAAPAPAPVAAPTAPPTAPVAAPTAPGAPVEGLRINEACQLAGLTDKDWQRNLGTVIKRRYGVTPEMALKGRGWVKRKKLWYPPAPPA